LLAPYAIPKESEFPLAVLLKMSCLPLTIYQTLLLSAVSFPLLSIPSEKERLFSPFTELAHPSLLLISHIHKSFLFHFRCHYHLQFSQEDFTFSNLRLNLI